MNAYAETRKLIKNGSIIVSANCQECGDTGRLQVHHNDYAKPADVRFLCRYCHYKLHVVNGFRAKNRPIRLNIKDRQMWANIKKRAKTRGKTINNYIIDVLEMYVKHKEEK